MFQFYGTLQPFIRLQPFIFLIFPLIISLIIIIIAVPINFAFVYLLTIPFLFSFAAIVWGIYPALVTTEKFFDKKGYSNVVLEYRVLKNFLLILIPLTILNNLFLILGSPNIELSGYFYNSLLQILLLNNVLAAFIRIITQVVKKDFRFYFAKGFCKIILDKNDEFEKMKFLFHLLNSYDKYLQRNLKIKINDINKIYSIVLSKDIEERDQITKAICNSLQGNKFNLAKYLSSLQQIPNSEFYIKESLIQELKAIGVFLAAAIPIIISIIQIIK